MFVVVVVRSPLPLLAATRLVLLGLRVEGVVAIVVCFLNFTFGGCVTSFTACRAGMGTRVTLRAFGRVAG